MKKSIILFSLLILFSSFIFSQQLKWTGAANDNSFFNETNWISTSSNQIPAQGSLDPGVPINFDLLIENTSSIVGGTQGENSNIIFGVGKLTIINAELRLQEPYGIELNGNTLIIENGVVRAAYCNNSIITLTSATKLYLSGSTPFGNNTRVDISSADAWMFLAGLNAVLAQSVLAQQVKIAGNQFSENTNARIVQYYNGCAVASYDVNYTPLTIYASKNRQGQSAEVGASLIYAGNSIPGNLNKNISSFVLKKGYMLTLAVEEDGTGLSKVYIASESDLTINVLPPALDKSISFIRVVPWVWVNKKGTGGSTLGVNASWYYNWGLGSNSDPDRQFAPMSWGKNHLNTQAKIDAVVNKKDVTYILSFNESDHCDGQSGQWGGLCIVDTAVLYHRNTMKTGLRILGPSCREGEELRWVKDMNDLAIPLGARMDVIGMHWYDWGGNPQNTPDENPVNIFNRFKNRVIACYNYYKMPIWITEFNANRYRNRWVQDEFLKLALPWMEETHYVERYAYFQPNGGNGSFFDAAGNITSTGLIYRDLVSTPSIREENMNRYINNLESRMNSNPSLENNLLVNGDFEATEGPSGWSKNNADILLSENNEFGINNQTCRMPGIGAPRWIWQNVEIAVPGKYFLEFKARIQNAAPFASGDSPNNHVTLGPATIKGEIIGFESDGNTLLNNALLTLESQSNTNITLRGEVEIPVNITKVQVKISKNWNVPYIDDVSFDLVKVPNSTSETKSGNSTIEIFPNPLKSGKLYIRLSGNDMLETRVSLSDLQGRVIMDQTITDNFIHIENSIDKGIYLLRISNNKIKDTRKIIIQ